jgi:two-component system, LytTR family, sensor kinase
MNIKWQSIIIRLSVIIIFQLIFKQGDLTFSSAFEPSLRSLLFSVYFIIYWMLFWEACSFIYKKLIKFTPDKRIWYRRLLLVTLILLAFVIVASLIFDWGYTVLSYYGFGISFKEDIHFINPDIFDPSDFFESISINPELLFGFMLFFILVYGAHIFIISMKNVKELEVIAAQQKKESITAQYTALKNQIDPHFFFNSLSVLSSLIYESTELSADYISHLSKHYRYILEMNADSLVTVGKELEHLDSYFFLIKIRHQDYIGLSVNLSEHTKSKCRILPHALLLLVENAVKHNIFKKDNQLIIEILEDDDFIIVRNNINKRRLLNESTGIGLQNISKRYAIEGNLNVLIEESGNYFVVKLPKIC